MAETIRKNVWEKSDDAQSLSFITVRNYRASGISTKSQTTNFQFEGFVWDFFFSCCCCFEDNKKLKRNFKKTGLFVSRGHIKRPFFIRQPRQCRGFLL